MHLYAHCSITHNSQSMDATQASTIDKRIKKRWYTCTMKYYSVVKKNRILPFATTWMDLEGIMLSEISQTEKDKHHVISLICEI